MSGGRSGGMSSKRAACDGLDIHPPTCRDASPMCCYADVSGPPTQWRAGAAHEIQGVRQRAWVAILAGRERSALPRSQAATCSGAVTLRSSPAASGRRCANTSVLLVPCEGFRSSPAERGSRPRARGGGPVRPTPARAAWSVVPADAGVVRRLRRGRIGYARRPRGRRVVPTPGTPSRPVVGRPRGRGDGPDKQQVFACTFKSSQRTRGLSAPDRGFEPARYGRTAAGVAFSPSTPND